MTRTAKNCESNVMSTDEFERFGYVNVPGLCANRVPARGLARNGSHPRLSNVLDISVRERVRACAYVSSRARACHWESRRMAFGLWPYGLWTLAAWRFLICAR